MFKRTKGFVGIILVIVLTSCTSSITESDMQIVLQTLTPANAIMRQPYKIEEVTEEV
jgi:DNA mismatch repair protein MutH